jgi:hypothetical protein
VAGGAGLMAGAAWAAAGATGQGSGLILAILITSAGVLVVTATRAPAGGLAMLLGVVLVFIAAIAVTANSAMSRIGSAWPSIESELRRSVANELELAVAGAADWAKTSAARALRLPNGQYRPFRELDLSLNANGGAAERGIVVYRDGRPWAWTGTVRQPVESLTASLGVAISPFYISLYASADSGNRRAVALQLLHAE